MPALPASWAHGFTNELPALPSHPASWRSTSTCSSELRWSSCILPLHAGQHNQVSDWPNKRCHTSMSWQAVDILTIVVDMLTTIGPREEKGGEQEFGLAVTGLSCLPPSRPPARLLLPTPRRRHPAAAAAAAAFAAAAPAAPAARPASRPPPPPWWRPCAAASAA